MKLESRYEKGSLKTSENGNTVEGYAAKYNVLSNDLGGFREIILPGAFDGAIERSPDISCNYEHKGPLLGRLTNGTLAVGVDDIGLWFRCETPDTTDAKNMLALIRRGDLDGCSFQFFVDANGADESWIDTPDGPVRQIHRIDHLGDCSIVYDPAYPETELAIRSLEAWKASRVPTPPPATYKLNNAKRRLILTEKWDSLHT